ncbi:MAG: helix-turn-helix domain-containing protein [Pseudomonadota bacterium]
MKNHEWALLDRLTEKFEKTSDFQPEIFLALAERLEEALSAQSRIPVHSLATQLGALLKKVMRKSPREAVLAAQGTAASDTVEAATYLLGQISFAQLLAAQVTERRADDKFLDIIRDVRYKEIVNSLLQHDCTGVELVARTSEQPETVSRKLKVLRELGISDFRREGNKLLNFLTPSAKAVIAEPEKTSEVQTKQNLIRSDVINAILENEPPYMRALNNFSTNSSPLQRVASR